MTISDNQRREVAQELRELRHTTYYREEIVENICDAISIADHANTFREPEDVYKLLADLIDPTCFDTESKDSKSFTCSACGFSESKLVVNPFTLSFFWVKPSYRYCPKCGAMVVEKEKDDDQ